MKRSLATLIAFVLVFSLTGCAASSTQNDVRPNDVTNAVSIEEASDYQNPDNWLVAPEKLTHDADVIYFYPTCYFPQSDDDPSVCTIDDEGMRKGAQVKLLDQASVFETSADIYAPYYRQVDATTLAGMTQEEMIAAESGEPKADVFAALDHYFETYNNDRPYFLAGHSQGSMMLCLILDEYMEQHPDRYKNMVAAYMIGNAATKSWLDENPHVKMAQGAIDTGVVVSWNTEGPGNIGKYNMVVPEGAVCINPLNWAIDATPASVAENKGSLVKDEAGNYAVVEGLANANVDVDRGSVICDNVDPGMYSMPTQMEPLFGPESYHGWDYKFFYMNIRENAEQRLASFLREPIQND